MSSTEQPIFLPLPDSVYQRAERFARDLAWGILNGWWQPPFNVFYTGANVNPVWNANGEREQRGKFDLYMRTVWGEQTVSQHTMFLLGFIQEVYTSSGSKALNITDKALSLLERPAIPPNAFISYKRGVSSAFALLVEARLRFAGAPPPFIDKNLLGGDEWHGQLEASIRSSQYFILLIGPETLKSKWIQKELAWAIEAKCRIIPVCHTGEKVDQCQEEIRQIQGHDVPGESAADYESAISFILNSMGYQTY